MHRCLQYLLAGVQDAMGELFSTFRKNENNSDILVYEIYMPKSH